MYIKWQYTWFDIHSGFFLNSPSELTFWMILIKRNRYTSQGKKRAIITKTNVSVRLSRNGCYTLHETHEMRKRTARATKILFKVIKQEEAVTYTRDSQLKTLKLRQKFEPQLDCLGSFNNDTQALKSGRQVAVRCRNATRRRSSSVNMAAPLAKLHFKYQFGGLGERFLKF